MKTLASSADLASIRLRITQVSPTDTRLWGSMTVHQMLCHLADAFASPLGQRPVAPIKASRIPTPIYKWLALRFPMKWPPGVPTPPEIDQRRGGTPPCNFTEDRAVLIGKLDQFAGSEGPWSPHPIFGVLSRDEWMRWGYLHTDHHLRQFGR